jgi:sugar phosphate isomerase/epimerase
LFKNLNASALGINIPFRGSLDLAQKTGFQGVDLNTREVAELIEKEGVNTVKQLFQKSGLKPGGCDLPVTWRGNEETFQADLDNLPRLIHALSEIGCTRVVSVVLPSSDERPYDENFHLHVERLQPIAKILKRYGCRLGLEFIGPKTCRTGQYEFIYNLQGMLNLCEAIGTGNVGILLDSWHWYTSYGTLEELGTLKNEKVVCVHINDAPAGIPIDKQIDNVRCLPNETGVIDLVGFLKALRKIGYDGPVTPEPFSKKLQQMTPLEATKTTIKALNKVWRLAGLD